MPYKMILNLTTGEKIESPIIAPNSYSKYGYSDRSIITEITKTGKSMVRNLKSVESFSIKEI